MTNNLLPQHRVYQWSFDSVVKCKNNSLIKSYYHKIEDVLAYHVHDFYEINIITGGSGRHYIGERELGVEIGDVFVIPPGVGHGYCSGGDLSVFHLLLSARFMNSIGSLMDDLDGFKMLFNIEPELRQRTEFSYYLKARDTAPDKLAKLIDAIDSVSECKNSREELDSAFQAGLLISYLAESIGLLGGQSTSQASDKRSISIIGAMEYIERHIDEPLDSKLLASKCAMSYSSFLRAFKRLTGKTPAEYQSAQRISKAEKLLLGRSDTVLGIAMELGYYDSAHFIKEFTRHKGITPTGYRKVMGKSK